MKLACLPLGMLCTALAAQTPACPTQPSHIDIASGSYGTRPGVTFGLRRFSALTVPMGRTSPLCYTRMTVVSRAEIFIDNATLTEVFADKLGGGSIRDFKVTNAADGATLSGTVTKIIPLRFSVHGPVTTDGKVLMLRATSVKADGIPVKALLQLVGEHLSSVLGLKNVAGVSAVGDTLIFAPEAIAHLKGHIEAALTSDRGLTLVYGGGRGAGRVAHRQSGKAQEAVAPPK